MERNLLMKSGNRSRRGFTLLEVLLVIAILGMLATVGIVLLTGTREGAKIDITRTLVDVVSNTLETYSMHLEQYPTEEQGGLKALLEKPQFEDEKLAEKWRGPYLKREPLDAWKRPLGYRLEEVNVGGMTRTVPRIWSNGPDGQEGTDDDIKNWSDEETM